MPLQLKHLNGQYIMQNFLNDKMPQVSKSIDFEVDEKEEEKPEESPSP